MEERNNRITFIDQKLNFENMLCSLPTRHVYYHACMIEGAALRDRATASCIWTYRGAANTG